MVVQGKLQPLEQIKRNSIYDQLYDYDQQGRADNKRNLYLFLWYSLTVLVTITSRLHIFGTIFVLLLPGRI